MKKRSNKIRKASSRDEITILVHGIWMHGTFMRVMGKMLQSAGLNTHLVSYDFLRSSPAENAAKLHEEITALNVKTIHLVGHSLGGIVILHILKAFPDLPLGKVVLIGSPVRGSHVAKSIHKNVFLRPLLGRSVEDGLLGGAPDYAIDRPLGIITGSGVLGLSALLYPSGENSDGVVKHSETQLKNVSDQVNIPYSHSVMIFSKQCAAHVVRFIQTGSFH